MSGDFSTTIIKKVILFCEEMQYIYGCSGLGHCPLLIFLYVIFCNLGEVTQSRISSVWETGASCNKC